MHTSYVTSIYNRMGKNNDTVHVRTLQGRSGMTCRVRAITDYCDGVRVTLQYLYNYCVHHTSIYHLLEPFCVADLMVSVET